jgi:hypothetical protein
MSNEFVERIEDILDECRNNLPTIGFLETLLETRRIAQKRINIFMGIRDELSQARPLGNITESV